MIAFDSQIGLSISSTKLQYVEINYNGREYLVENVDEAYFDEPIDLISDKEIKSQSVLQTAFNEIIIRKPLKTHRVAVSLPAEAFFIQQFAYDNTLIEEDVVSQFKWEMSVLYPTVKVEDLIFEHFSIEKNLLLPYNNTLVVAFPRKCMNVVHNFCKKNNLYLRFSDYSHFAADKILELNSEDFAKGWYLSLFISDKCLSFEILLEGRPVFLKLFKDIEAAEYLRQINIILNKSGLEINRDLIKGAVIWGEDLSPQTLATFEEQLRMKCIRINPFSGIHGSKALATNKYLKERSFSFASSAGIAYRLI